jgi:DNA (cytosine-5)-methyltransferase 1
MPRKKSFLTVTDQFCGAGGSSLGAAASGMEVMLAMNHWQLALMSYYGSNGNQRQLNEAMGTVTATERHALVQVPFLLGYANGDGPAKTAVDPLRTVHTENGQALAQPHGIAVDDCYFRMLQPHEIGRGMAFPETYTVLGNKREQVRQYGNAVTPVAMRQILQRCAATFN